MTRDESLSVLRSRHREQAKYMPSAIAKRYTSPMSMWRKITSPVLDRKRILRPSHSSVLPRISSTSACFGVEVIESVAPENPYGGSRLVSPSWSSINVFL